MLTIEYAKNPVYASEAGDVISLDVKFAEFDRELPFGATSFDDMPYGVELYNRAVAGEFGPVAPMPQALKAATEPQPVVVGAQTL